MTTEILINVTDYEVRLALIEDGRLSEFHLQRSTKKGLVGNVYKGKVACVLPGMQAAFVDIGLNRTGFLYVDDVHVGPYPSDNDSSGTGYGQNDTQDLHIEDILFAGQDILVQVYKDPIGSKGAKLTCHISLPCRNLVFIPHTDHIGVSRKIKDEEVRAKLKALVEDMRSPNMGFIVRTVAEYAAREELDADMQYLELLWQSLIAKAAQVKAPCIVHEDLDITLRSVRDFFTSEVDNLIIDDPIAHKKLLQHVSIFAPELTNKILLYLDTMPLFESYNIEIDISRAIDKKVWLRSGGYLMIESTEALSVIDVNTGRYIGQSNLNDTIFKTNLEAAIEIAYQLRLRDIGGIIIIDFINMKNEDHREKVCATFKDTVKKDKSQNHILEISEFGLIQMTRKRNSDSLQEIMTEPCNYCSGKGIVKSRRTICYDIFRIITKNSDKYEGTSVSLHVHPIVANLLLTEEYLNKKSLEKNIGKKINTTIVNNRHIEKFDIVWHS